MDTTEFLDEVKHITLYRTYQDRLYSVARSIGAKVIVESGVRNGVSTRFLLEAIKKNGAEPIKEGLFSCDSMYPLGQRQALVKVSEVSGVSGDNWFFVGKRSVDALPMFVSGNETTGYPLPEWDLFLADSDHNSECQVYELEFALGYVRAGGIIAVNNWKGEPTKLPHGQVVAWAERHGLVGTEAGTAMFFEAPGPGPGTLKEKWLNAVSAGIDAVTTFQKTKAGASERARGPLSFYLDRTF